MKSYCTNPSAIAARARRLLDPAWAEHVNAHRNEREGRKVRSFYRLGVEA